jgi:hypothetical protein
VLLSACGLLALGGWALYYAADERARSWLSISHWGLGLALPTLVIGHIIGARRERLADEQAARRQIGL